MRIPILHETPKWLAVNKPGGLIVEENPFESPTVESLVFDYLKQAKPRPFLGIVHRLDRVTSGVLVMAKKKSTLRNLNEQFAQRRVRKTYLAVVETAPEIRNGELQHWLLKDQKNKKAIIYNHNQKGAKKVKLKYKTLEQKESRVLLEIEPLTGKFHQIRAQLASIGCPVAGDEKYGSKIPPMGRSIALHAWKLQLLDPLTNEVVNLQAPTPGELYWDGLER